MKMKQVCQLTGLTERTIVTVKQNWASFGK